MRQPLARPTRCLLVQPLFSGHSFWNYAAVCELVGAKYPAAPLGLMTVAALLPQDWEFRLIDENVQPLTDAHIEWADMVLTGGMLPQQKGVLKITQRAHDKGKPVVVGGSDPTSQPHMYETADFLVLGEGEVTIPDFLADLRRGVLSGVYHPRRRADMAQAVIPRFDLIRFADYLHVGVQFSRGCPFNCEFCDIIELFGRQPRTKAPDQVLAELQSLYDLGYSGHVDFVDDNFLGNKSKASEVLAAVSDWSQRHDYPFYFSTEASINLVQDQRLLGQMQESDFRFVFVGIESPDDQVLSQTNKTQNRQVSVVDAVKTLGAHGMIVNGGFILGFDDETEHTASRMIDMIQRSGICMAMVGTLTALPNTQLYHRLARERRLFQGGLIVRDATTDVDQTTSGLNFITARPRTAILQDHIAVLKAAYDPKRYYERVLTTATHLAAATRRRPSFAQALELGGRFLRVSRRIGFNLTTGLLYWRTLLRVLLTNPRALEATVSLAAMYIHFSEQSRFVIRTLEERIAFVEGCGEDRYNQLMTVGSDAGTCGSRLGHGAQPDQVADRYASPSDAGGRSE